MLFARRFLRTVPETRALFNAMTANGPTSLYGERKFLIDRTIRKLLNAGLWSKLDILYMLAAHDEQAGRLNWKSPGTFTCTAVNSPTFTTDRSVAGNGTTSYLRTGYNPGTSGGTLAQNSHSFGVWTPSAAAADTAEMGSNNISLGIRAAAGVPSARSANTSPAGSTVLSDGVGLTSANRTDGTGVQFRRNGVATETVAQNSGAIADSELLICGRNSATGGVTFSGGSSKPVACVYAGGFFSASEEAALYGVLLTYMQAVGAA